MAREPDHKLIPPPDDASSMSPSDARTLFRKNGYSGCTAEFCSGYARTNIVILPKKVSDDFKKFCEHNSGPLPLLYSSEPGEVGAACLATNSNIRTDLPCYIVYRKGHIDEYVFDLSRFESEWDEYVSFYLGCSLAFETAMIEGGVQLGYGKNESLYTTNITLHPVGPFEGKMIVYKCMIAKDQLKKVFMISSQYPNYHGAPVHIGDPSRIGISGTEGEEFAVKVRDGDVPIFWGCGMTVQEVILSSKPQLAFSHYPGSMFITDVKAEPKDLDDEIEIIQLSRRNDAYYASVIGHNSLPNFEALEQLLLDDTEEKGIAHLFQKCDLLKAVLTLSHARTVAVTTGFPVCTEFDVTEETNGPPGALAVCQALLSLGKDVTLIIDERRENLYVCCVKHMVDIGAIKGGSLAVIPFEKAKKKLQQNSTSSTPVYDCLLSINRPGRNRYGTYCSIEGEDISHYVQPIDELFEVAQQNPRISTIGIGDNGNELGMGRVYSSVVNSISLGETIACSVSVDYLIVAGVSDWGGYAVACGLYVASNSPYHWRYRNYAISADQPPKFDLHKFLPTTDQISSLLKYMNQLGFRDGGKVQLVDGPPHQIHLKKLSDITALASGVHC